MKKIIALILALVMVMSFAACGSTPAEPSEPSEPAAPAESPETVDPGNEPAVPGEGPEDDMNMPAVMPDVTDTDLPAEPVDPPVATDSDLANPDENLPLLVLNAVWASYADDEKFAAMGGDYSNNVMDAPGACSLATPEDLDALFGLPVSEAGSVAAAASLMHMMNANTFTSACYQLSEGADVDAFVQAVKENILSRQWMCGFPETLIIVDVEGYIVTAFGNGEIIELFKNKLGEVFSAEVLVEEAIA